MESGFYVQCVKYQKVVSSPLKKSGFVPGRNCEVFVRNIPVDATELDLLKFFQGAGEVWQLKLMMTEDGK